jgi:cystathionine gamma-synthase
MKTLRPVTQALATRLAHAGCVVCPVTGALTPPLHPSSTFERNADLTYTSGYIYARTSNPTRNLLEAVLADVETPLHQVPGEALSFSSGVAAAHAIFQGLPNGHVLLPDDVYHGNRTLLKDVFGQWGLKTTQLDMRDLDSVNAALHRNTRENVVLWAESPSNPLLKVTDIKAVGLLAKEYNVPFVVDATMSSCWNIQPIGLGADLVVHSTTKYYGGHSDLTGGAVIKSSTCKDSAQALFKKAQFHQGTVGATPSSFDCWLTLRGMRSLRARMDLHSHNGMQVAKFLEENPNVSQVFYPGLEKHPGHDIMTRQSRAVQEGVDGHGKRRCANYGGMVSFLVKGPREQAIDVVGATEIFKRATSLGGTESLIEHRASVEGPNTLTPNNLIRLSVGLEDSDDLIEDLKQAFVSALAQEQDR